MAVWGESKRTNKLYEDRVSGRAEEMGCARQLVNILSPHVKPGMSVLDVGCSAGYFYHSLNKLSLEYYGIDPTKRYIEIGRRFLPKFGLDPERLQIRGIEDIEGMYDVVICFTVMQHLPLNLKKYLKILTDSTRHFLVIRASFCDGEEVIQGQGIDIENHDNKRPVITYPKHMIEEILNGFGFTSNYIIDEYTNGRPERPFANDVLVHSGIYFASRNDKEKIKC